MFRLFSFSILFAMLGMALGSCATPPAGVGGFAWNYQQNDGEGAKLAYGAPQSDAVLLMMSCAPDSNRVQVSMLGGSEREGVVLASNGARDSFGGQAQTDPMSGGQVVQVEVPANAPSLTQFARTGELTLIDRGRSVQLSAQGGEKAGVSRFFADCRA
ncbi:hypothetical protein QO010_000111 [Caulobacter ginsengisoli]|uniref:Uncharacterized protein n=1 Tax=Caulobacter ginsengisoli TaxID=400775 RepID=A0ABU0IK29_9CAUL|nr:hypothetical protein [Caulobacter ginsengisoli]MDQ0462363.1 hypothetical protein [Caulobacter ginsengisoli]